MTGKEKKVVSIDTEGHSNYCALVVEGVKVISGVKVYTIGEEAAILFTLIPTHHEFMNTCSHVLMYGT